MPQPKFWQTKSLPALALWPLACVYSVVSKTHLALRGLCPYRASVPVISVGNINVGGVGKTPVVEFLARELAGQGHRVAILSRGYGGQYQRPHLVTAEDTAADVGDEPAMLYQTFKNASVDIWVAPNRKASAKRAINAGATVLVLDDGFQYRGLARDLNLVVLDGTQSGKYHLGNGFTLPAGPLRETPYALNRADALIVMNSTAEERVEKEAEAFTSALQKPVFHISTSLHKGDIKTIAEKTSASAPIFAFAGIGNPQKFFTALTNALKSEKITITEEKAFPDHHKYPKNTLKHLANGQNYTWVTTEKDAIKFPAPERRKLNTVRLHLTGESLAKLKTLVHNTIQ